MPNFGDIIGIGYRVIAHRSEIAALYDKIIVIVRNTSAVYPEVTELIDKIAPGVITPADVPMLARGLHEPDGEHYSAKWLQESLNTLESAGLVVDGEIGPTTKAVVLAFQQKYGLKQDSWAGGDTVAKIVALLDKHDTAG